jgi:hypothetical protein
MLSKKFSKFSSFKMKRLPAGLRCGAAAVVRAAVVPNGSPT